MIDTRDQLQISLDFLSGRDWTCDILNKNDIFWYEVGLSGDCYNFMPITLKSGKIEVPMPFVHARNEQAVIGYIVTHQVMNS